MFSSCQLYLIVSLWLTTSTKIFEVQIYNAKMLTTEVSIPTIDMSPLYGDNTAAKLEVARHIDAACRGTGFFFAKGHGVDCLREFFNIVDHFHKKITDKERWEMAIAAYDPQHKDHILTGYYLPVKDKKTVQSFYIQNPTFSADHPLIQANTPLHEINVWPDAEKYPGFREFIETYYWKAFNVSKALLRGIALALGKDQDFFEPFFQPESTMSSMRLIRYPYIDPYPPGAIKTAADGTKLSFETHADVSLLTVLYQPFVANLQVDTADGYKSIPSSDDCYLVNGGLFCNALLTTITRLPSIA
ncbi:uncharacterized protein LOC129593743 [Paramacrobiotus metropolitanus]|uniref:uncharacterized protein LOC129593743 n=1 Tax=Paramacrobiotus metropolitanus TaxID=2943436 RepID=UPI0024460DD1|nr:uncharacterized protein LOC129593743 [Paramacrobiotus metropolitanus]